MRFHFALINTLSSYKFYPQTLNLFLLKNPYQSVEVCFTIRVSYGV